MSRIDSELINSETRLFRIDKLILRIVYSFHQIDTEKRVSRLKVSEDFGKFFRIDNTPHLIDNLVYIIDFEKDGFIKKYAIHFTINLLTMFLKIL